MVYKSLEDPVWITVALIGYLITCLGVLAIPFVLYHIYQEGIFVEMKFIVYMLEIALMIAVGLCLIKYTDMVTSFIIHDTKNQSYPFRDEKQQ